MKRSEFSNGYIFYDPIRANQVVDDSDLLPPHLSIAPQCV